MTDQKLGAEAYDLAEAFYELGDLTKAAFFFRLASERDVAGAEEKLRKVNDVIASFADLDEGMFT